MEPILLKLQNLFNIKLPGFAGLDVSQKFIDRRKKKRFQQVHQTLKSVLSIQNLFLKLERNIVTIELTT